MEQHEIEAFMAEVVKAFVDFGAKDVTYVIGADRRLIVYYSLENSYDRFYVNAEASRVFANPPKDLANSCMRKLV